MEVLTSVLLTLIGVAASLGLSAGSDEIARKNARNGNMTPDQIINEINSKLNLIKSKSFSKYTSILNRFNNMPIIAETGGLRSYMASVRSKRQKELTKAQQDYNDIEQKVNDLTNRSNLLANQSDYYRSSSSGKEDLDRIKDDANELIENFNNNNNSTPEVNKIEKTI